MAPSEKPDSEASTSSEWRDRMLGSSADTEVAATTVSPEADTPLAWSADQPVFDYPATGPQPVPAHKPPHSTMVVIAVLALALVTVTLALCIVDLGVRRQSRETPQAAPPSTAPALAPPAAAPSSAPSSAPTSLTSTPTPEAVRPCMPAPATEYPDSEFVSIVVQSGLCIYDPEPMIALGHRECRFLSTPGPGHTVNDAVDALSQRYLQPRGDLTLGMVYSIVHAAITAYCPEFSDQL